MTTQKKLKRAVRARAKRTGESYTAARRQVLARRRRGETSPAAGAAKPGAAPRRAAGLGDAAVTVKTGHGYAHWFAVLDAFGAATKGHTASARHLASEHGVPGWHAQGITVAYERERGLRAVNQQTTGTWQVSVSKALPVGVRDAADAFTSARRRAAWLAAADRGLRDALEAALAGGRAVKLEGDRLATLRYKWDGATVEVRITPKPKGPGCTVAIGNVGLPESGLVETRRAQWRAALSELHGAVSA